jgi:DNA-binding XRE family transcriptional regulator
MVNGIMRWLVAGDLTFGKVWPTPQLIRAARGLANIDQETLAAAAGVSRKAIISLEGDKKGAMDYRRLDVLQKIRTVLEEKWHIEFVRENKSLGVGVHVRKAGGAGS